MVKRYNSKLKQNLRTKFSNIEDKVNDKLEVKASDSQERKAAKVKAKEGLSDFFKRLFGWLGNALEWLMIAMSPISVGIKWCYEHVVDLFREAISFLF